jgi:spermidine synthase
MYLFRVASLVFGPFPYTFSLVLALFLLTWSLGVGVARFVPRWIPFWLIAAAISLAVVPRVYQVARAAPAVAHSDDFLQSLLSSKWALFGLCYVPCLLFGILFTHVVERFAKSWGADVGRYFAFNTFGSCAGILVGTLVGFEFAPEWTPWTAAVAMAAIPLATLRTWTVDPAATPSRQQHRFAWGALAVFLAVGSLELIHWNRNGRSMEQPEIEAAYYGRGGVILIDRELNLEWDGLWHSELRQGDNHVGTSNWRMAVIPFLCRNRDRCPDVCVIGLGTGITAGTLSRIRGVERIDVYEINEELKRVLADYPDGTMHVATDPRITIHWQDGRSGLALHDRKYDLITQQPLWLKQAGSSTLLSREYFELVKSRLKPDGVFCIYCNTADWMGTEEQARTVRQTARSVFPYGETFVEGYMLVVSRQPFRFDRRRIEARLANEPTLRRECEAFGIERLAGLFDANRLSWKSPYLVTDDHPIIEYPYITRMLVRRAER